MKNLLLGIQSRILELPPICFYAGLGFICLCLIGYSFSTKDSPDHSASDSERSDRLFATEPTKILPQANLVELLDDPARNEARKRSQLQSRLKNLEHFIAKTVEGKQSTQVDWFSDELHASQFQRSELKTRFKDDQLVVRRYRKSKTAKDVEGEEAFANFVENTLKPWKSTNEFRIQLECFQTEFKNDQFTAIVFAEAFGRNKAGIGLQANSLWKLTFADETEKTVLTSIDVLAHEEIAVNNPKGRLLLDYTASVLESCDCWQEQFAYGIDEWSLKVPNMDALGNQGLAVGDINGDDLDDIYVCQGHGLPNRLLVQNPDGTVEDVSRTSNLDVLDASHSALMIDVDNDGDQDLVVATDENLLMFSNKGDASFQLEHRLSIGRNAHSVVAADYDLDGDLDLFLCKYLDVNRQPDLVMFPVKIDKGNDGGRNVLLRNDEGWNFVDVTEQVGITQDNSYFTRSAAWIDFDLDGDQDLYVSNEFATDQLLENQDGWFTDVSNEFGVNVAAKNRSVSVGEFNQDGKLDLFVGSDAIASTAQFLGKVKDVPFARTLKQSSRVLMPGPNGAPFSSLRLPTPILSSDSTFSTSVVDLNNDGFDDVLVTNGELSRISKHSVEEDFYQVAFQPNDSPAVQLALTSHVASDLVRNGCSFGGKQRNRCFFGIQGGLANGSSISGFDLPEDARGVSVSDWDGDGDADVVVTCRTAPQLRIFGNQTDERNDFLHFKLTGTKSNRDAIGARVEVFLSGKAKPLVKMLQAGSGNLSQSSKRLMFGLGKNARVTKVVVYWPAGTVQAFTGVQKNASYKVLEGRDQLSEQSSQRFNLAIKPRALDGAATVPMPQHASVFYPKAPLPVVQYQLEEGKWFNFEAKEKRSTLVVFVSANADSTRCLKELERFNTADGLADLDVVPIYCDPDSNDHRRDFDRAGQLKAKSGWSGEIGSASDSTETKLEYVVGEWFNCQQFPQLPFAILVDEHRQVSHLYPTNALSTKKIVADQEVSNAGEFAFRNSAALLGGRWYARYRFAKLNRLRIRYRKLGLNEDVDLLERMSLPQRAFEYAHKAIELGGKGETSSAMSLFDKATTFDPNCILAYVGQGDLLRQMATSSLQTSEESRVEMLRRASGLYAYAIELDPLNSEAVIGKANVAIEQGKNDEALAMLQEYVQIDPRRYEVHAIVGRLLFHQRKYKEAAAYLLRAYENRPTLPFVAGDLGYLYLVSGQKEEAKKFLKLAHRLQPSDKNIIRLLGEAELATGGYVDAVELFERVTRLDPNRRRAKNILAWLLATCPFEEQRDANRASEIISPLVEIFGDSSPVTLEISAACAAEKGEFENAFELQTKALKLVQDSESTEFYSETQKTGLRTRLELYRRKKPYRMADLNEIPIAAATIRR